MEKDIFVICSVKEKELFGVEQLKVKCNLCDRDCYSSGTGAMEPDSFLKGGLINLRKKFGKDKKFNYICNICFSGIGTMYLKTLLSISTITKNEDKDKLLQAIEDVYKVVAKEK